MGRQVRAHRRLPRQVRHLAARAARLRHGAPGARDGPHRVPRPSHVPRGRRLLGLGLRGTRRARPHQRQLGRRALRDRLHRPRPGARPARGHAKRAGLGGRLLLVRDARDGDEVRRARVQGDGHGPVRAREVRRARGGGPARGLRSGGRPARALPLARPGRALPAPAACHGRSALRLGRGRRPAPARGRAAALEPPHAPALRRRAARPGRRRLHEREGQHAARPGGLGGGALRLPVLRRRVERGGRGLSRVRAGVRAARAWPPRRSRSGRPTSAPR